MKTRALLITVFLIFLCGCATQGMFESTMNSWQEEKVDHLVKVWGTPERRVPSENGDIYVYSHPDRRFNCQEQFLVQKDVVKGWRRAGDKCLFTSQIQSKYTAESATWNTKENRKKETHCVTSQFGGAGFTECSSN
jgi:hypothetical protein